MRTTQSTPVHPINSTASSSIDIAQLMKATQSSLSCTNQMEDQEAVVLIGNTGVGKTTTIHFMVGSRLKLNKSNYNIVAKCSKTVEDFKIGKGATSETKSFGSVNLKLPNSKYHINYELEKPIYLCDTPGLSDTDGKNAAIANAIAIVHPLQNAKSVRLMVLFSHADFHMKGSAVRETLESIARLLPNTIKHTQSIIYCVTGDLAKDDKKHVEALIDDLIDNQENLHYSDDVKVLLKDMRKKFNEQGIPVINPFGKNDSIKPQKLMHMILALTPIMKPRQAFMPYVEKASQEALTLELNNLFTEFQEKIQFVRKNIANNAQQDFAVELARIDHILAQFKFIHDVLEPCDPQEYLLKCKDIIANFSGFLIETTQKIFNLDDAGKEISKNSFEQFKSIWAVQKNCRLSWIKHIDKKHAPQNLIENEMYTRAKEYQEDLSDKLQQLTELSLVRFRYQLMDQLLNFINSIENNLNETQQTEFPGVPLSISDAIIKKKIEENLHYLHIGDLDSLTFQYKKYKKKFTRLQTACSDIDNPTSIQYVLDHLKQVEKYIEVTPISPDYQSLAKQHASDLLEQFNVAVKLLDYRTAAGLLDTIQDYSPHAINKLKNNFIKSLNALIDNRSDLNKGKSFIFIMHLLHLLMNDANINKHFKTFATKKNKISLLSIYHLCLAKVNEEFNKIEAAITAVLIDEKNVEGILSLDVQFKQLWSLQNIPVNSEDGDELKKSWQRIREKLKIYVEGFRQRFSEKLTSENLPENFYLDIDNYLYILKKSSWVHILQLAEETTNKLLESVAKHAKLLISQLTDATAKQYEHYADSLKYISISRELKIIFDTFKDCSTTSDWKELKNDLAKACTAFHDKNMKINKLIIDNSKDFVIFKQLSIQQMVNYSNYISSCETIGYLNTEDTKSSFVNALVELMQDKLEQIKNHLLTLSVWQSVNSSFHPNEKDIACVTKELIDNFHAIKSIKQNLPEHYQHCGQPTKKYKSLLINNLYSFYQQLSHALIARLENPDDQAAELKLEQMIFLCSQLQVLDDYLPKDVSLEIKKYASLYKKYNKSVSNTYRELFSEILTYVRKGQYGEAVTKSDQLVSEAGIKKVLVTQTSMIIMQLTGKMEDNNKRLRNSTSTIPDDLASMQNDLILIMNAQQLVASGLLNDAAINDCNAILTKSQSAIDQWFMNSFHQLDQAIDHFHAHYFKSTIDTLRSTVVSMHSKPSNWESQLQVLSDRFSHQLVTITQHFDQPIAKWNSPFSLAELYRQFIQYDATHWFSLSLAVSKVIYNEIINLKEKIEANSDSVSHLIELISHIEKQVIPLPQEETRLKQSVLQQCQDSLHLIFTHIIKPEIHFDDYLTRIVDMMQANNKLTYPLNQSDWEGLLARLRSNSADLRDKIIISLRNNKCPETDLLIFINMYLRIMTFTDVIKPDLTLCKKEIGTFITQLFRNLSDGFAYQKRNLDVSLSLILTSNQLLTQIMQLRKAVDKKGKILIDSMLPNDFHNEISKYLLCFNAIFTSNNETFLQCLHNKDVNGLLSTLRIAFAWANVTNELDRFISACDEDQSQEAMVKLATTIKQFHHTALIKSIENELTKLINKVTLNISTYLNNPEKGIATREDYYLQLIKTMEFISNCEQLKPYLDATNYKTELLQSTQTYLTQLYTRILKELPEHLDPNQNWETFDDCYKDLSLFAKHCTGYLQHLGNIVISTDGTTLSSLTAANAIDLRFNHFIYDELSRLTNMIENETKGNQQDIRKYILNFLVSLQKIINTSPSKSVQIKQELSQVLLRLREKYGVNYFQLLMTELQTEESGLGLDMINQQTCFRGMSIALRNTRTSAQDIEYVLTYLTQKQASGEMTPPSEEARKLLRNAYAEFQSLYDKLLAQYLKPEVKFDDNPTKHLKILLNDLKEFIQKDPIRMHGNNKIIWDETAIKKLPVIMAFLFVIWTLRDAKHYFEANASSDSTHYLKKPHPGQVIAILRMLNVEGSGNGLSSHLVQTLSGEGKSIVVAITAIVLSLCGFSVSCACYSEYLSSRDFTDFAPLFELLEVGQYIKYGTFNTLCEDILNEQGDLRHLIENVITRGDFTLYNKREQRQTIVIIDEVDVFFNRAFYGSFYNPVLHFNPSGSKEISDLITMIWNYHKNGHSLSAIEIKKSPAYLACIHKWHSLAPLLDNAIKDMLQALQQYRDNHGHHYTVINGKIAYPYHDGTTSDIYKGYKTMWAYYYEHEHGKINDAILAQNIGMLLNCGHYAYSEMLKDMGLFHCILGVTGTLQELSKPEQAIVRDEFLITQQSFIPSVYGPNRLRFAIKDAVKIESEAHYYSVLAKEIQLKQMGTSSSEAIRPILVFFEDQTSLMNFYNSKELKELGMSVSVMTQKSSSNIAEQNSEISKATSPGQVTLLVKEKGRGRDFYCQSPKIEANGGMHVILAFFPDQVSLETQLFYRTARQGLDGSASMVLNEAELMEKFELSKSAIQQMRDTNTIYQSLNEIRITKFADTYGALTKEMTRAREVLHLPSLELWQQLHMPNKNCNKLLALLDGLNPATNENRIQHVSRTLILMDATGSMSSLINGVKQTVTHVMNNLTFALKANHIDPNNVALQIAIYRNYWESSDMLFQASPWAKSENVALLNSFINNIEAVGGSQDNSDNWSEAVEVGLCHALLETDKTEALTQVILIGDTPPNSVEKLNSYDPQHAGGHRFDKTHKNKFYSRFEPAHVLTGKLAEKKIPVFTFFVEECPATKEAFSEIAQATHGTAEYLDVQSANAGTNLLSIFGKTVLTDVASGDEKLKQELLKTYGEISHSGMGPGKKS